MSDVEPMTLHRNGKMIRQFMDWMTERHDIYLRRRDGKPWPWTKDEIMQTYRFTNVYRELDAVTLGLHKRFDVLPLRKDPLHERMYRVILYRAFNWPDTYDRIHRAHAQGRFDVMRRVLHQAKRDGHKVFTGAYIITNAGSKRSKIDLMCDAMEVIFKARRDIWSRIEADGTMRGATKILTEYPSLGNFTAYEVVCDLRHQRGMLDRAPDRSTWANLGPGARRGIQRIHGGGARKRFKASEEFFVGEMQFLLRTAYDLLPQRTLRVFVPGGRELEMEMREIEHAACEFDKFLRAKRGEGRPRSKYVYEEAK